MLRAALWDEQLHFRALLLCQPCFEQRNFRQIHRQKDFARDERRTVIILLEEGCKQSLIRLVLAALQQEVFAADHLARADEEDLHADADFRPRHADGVLVACARHDVLLLRDFLDGRELVAQPRRELEMIGFRRRLHAVLELFFDVDRTAFEEHQHGTDHPVVFLFRNFSGARREAALDMVFEAWPVLERLAISQRK